ncbi:DNA topoisomerase 2 [Bodo saltans virus]|uniref:DNA topoisomerase 2 n=1 Tax=Bodo saltans virus TaxID=2024608 RepID=A0A2H4UU40_9VIRU|nr:DNA topoisomerase 2 [Bodo saltans virus]ATZ80450.1 DNA topoisomerase 2 [Bodo saltans virus]
MTECKISKQYQKKDPRQHVLDRPTMWLGSIDPTVESCHVFDIEEKKIVKKDITRTFGFHKIIDESIVNARDHCIRDKTCKIIDISFSQEEGWISIYNTGAGIPVIVHEEHKIYIPELIFGNLLSSSNYDDTEERVVGGLNGVGIKICNIYSIKFIIETVDTVHGKKKYTQEFRNNMSDKDEPIITKVKSTETPYTKITYYPDFKRFGMKCLTDDDVAYIYKRAYDISACTHKDVQVSVNGKLLNVKNFNDYINLYYDSSPPIIYRELNDRWKVGIVFVPNYGNHSVSFVNSIETFNGGTHVNYVFDQIIDKVIEQAKKKSKFHIKPSFVKEHLDIFVDATIVNPEFPSQTKSELVTKVAKFGSTCSVTDSMMKEIFATKLIDLVVENAEFKEIASLSKTDGKKQSVINVPKLEDARLAGTKDSLKCRLILTEGDSAKAFAMSGLVVIGKDRYGVFPLRGKLLNPRNANLDQIKKNQELTNLKTIMGLEHDKRYTTPESLKKLRYGGVVILTDQDPDGSHIKGLIINFFQFFWPELLKIEGFIQTLLTPLIKAFKKTDKNEKNPVSFYSERELQNWIKNNDIDVDKWNIDYYKGLGTSTEKEQKQAFKNYDDHVATFIWESLDKTINKPKSIKKNNNNDNNNDDNINDINDDNNDDDNDDDSDSDESLIVDTDIKEKVKKTSKKKKITANITDPEIMDSISYDTISLAFDDERADDRKNWLSNYNRDDVLEYSQTKIGYSEFINKDLIHFSNYNLIRSVPSIMDGLKPSQRKILYICLKENIKKYIKVNQLSAEVSKNTAYKHGETSLEETIVGMAQDYPGANNINLLVPRGNFGYRNEDGANHGSSRYIKTCLESITEKIFIKQDNSILNYLQEEGDSVEPEYYYPILPLVLINGALGIGTGYSTYVPQYNPIDICNNLLNRIDDKPMKKMIPWYQGFKGNIEEESNTNYRVYGNFEITDKDSLAITEIPIKSLYSATNKYEENIIKPLAGLLSSFVTKDDKDNKRKKKVETKKKKPIPIILSSYFKYPGNNVVNFEVKFIGNELQKLIKAGGTALEDTFKLTSTITTTNMYLYNSKGVITKYKNVLDIMEEFYVNRLKGYEKRKIYYMRVLSNELMLLKYKVKFIKDYLDKKIKIEREKKDKVIEQLIIMKFPVLHNNVDAPDDKKTYDYITSMQLFSLTSEKIEELENEYKKKQAEYDDYDATSIKELWKRDLQEFIISYNKWLLEKAEREEDEDDENGGTAKKKKSKKTKK